MGLTFSHWLRFLPFGKKEVKILMIGLDNAGKTTILYKLKLGEVEKTISTIGFNVQTVEYKNLCFTVWDVGGEKQARQLWRHYFVDNSAIIFVVDSADVDRIDMAARELHTMMEGLETKNPVVLILANKQDLPNALSASKMTERLRLNKLKQPWHLHPVCAVKGTGLMESLDKLSQMLLKQKSL